MELPASLRERYEAVGALGEGGFGAVLRCRDRRLGRDVAIKLLTLGDDPEVVARFEREARVTAALKHPHVVEVYDHGVADGVPWIAYEYLEGVDLDRWCREHGLPDPERLARWAAEGAEALAVVHDAGLIHRDVKPANVLIRRDDEALVLVDFGISRATERAAGTLHTAEGVILGTVGYMAPELLGGVPPSPASDQWAWGAVLSELLTGRPPYGSHDPREVLGLAASFRPGDRVAPGPAGPVLRRALAPDPRRRFPDMRALADATRQVRWEPAEHRDPRREARTEELVGRRSSGGGAATVPLARAGAGAPTEGRDRRPWALAALVVLGIGLGIVGTGGGPTAPSPAPTPPPATGPSVEELGARLRERERVLREVAAPPGSLQPWRWIDDDPDFPPRDRSDERVTYAGNVEVQGYELPEHWNRTLEALRDWLVAVDALPAARRLEVAPEVYRDDRVYEFLKDVVKRCGSLSGENTQDTALFRVQGGLRTDLLREARATSAYIGWVHLRMRRKLQWLAEELGEIPEASPRLRRLRWLVLLLSGLGDRHRAFREVLARLPDDPKGLRRWRLKWLQETVLEDRAFLADEAEEPDLPEACSRTQAVLPDLRELTLQTSGVKWQVELLSRQLLLELRQRQLCRTTFDVPEAPPVAALVARLLARLEELEGPPSGLDQRLDAMDDRLDMMAEAGDPLAAEFRAQVDRLDPFR